MEKRRLIIVISFIIAGFIVSGCKHDSNKPDSNINSDLELEIDLGETLGDNEILVYTIPSPFQASALSKMLGLEYSSELLKGTRRIPENAITSYQKALNLGVCLVDMGYANIYEQSQLSMNYLMKVKGLMEDLNLNTPREIEYLVRVENNLHDDDSLKVIYSQYRDGFDANSILKRDKKIGLLVLCGFYVESLHMIVEIYEDNAGNKNLNNFIDRSLRNSIYQQSSMLSNLIELLEEYDDNEIRSLISQFGLLTKKFDEMQISCSIDKKNESISIVKMKEEKLPGLQSIINRIRQGILS